MAAMAPGADGDDLVGHERQLALVGATTQHADDADPLAGHGTATGRPAGRAHHTEICAARSFSVK